MNWLENKTTQIIALVGIVSTLAGVGYTGAQYVNRLENLEAKIGGVDENMDEMKIIEERFASIETSVEFLEKEIDKIQVPDVAEIKSDIAGIKVSLSDLKETVSEVKEDLKDLDKNPLQG